MNKKFDYDLKQLSDTDFKYDLSLGTKDIIGDWVEETFEAEEYHFYDVSHSLHAYSVFIRFSDIENATAFKLRWAK